MGSITGAYYVVKWKKDIDLRSYKSGNVGATNAGRLLGREGFLLTLFIDFCKVILTLWLTESLFMEEKLLLINAYALLFGHLFPPQLNFKGGKGVVVFLSITLYIAPVSFIMFSLIVGFLSLTKLPYTQCGFISMSSIPITALMLYDSLLVPISLLGLLIIIIVAHIQPKRRMEETI